MGKYESARATYAPIWNKGLTKEDHPSLVKMGITMSKNTKGIPRPYAGRKQGTRRFWYYGDGYQIKMRSRWEVAFVKLMDRVGVTWWYEYCTFVMDEYSFTPDFYFPETGDFCEVKGFMDDRCEEKLCKFVDHFGIPLMVLGQEALEKLGVVDKHGRVIEKASCERRENLLRLGAGGDAAYVRSERCA